MTATVRATANYILNRVGVEVGLKSSTNPFESTDDSYIQMKTLLNVAGDELCQLWGWHFLTKQHSITTAVPSDTGDYDFPDDYLRMVNQTHWQTNNLRPLAGPLSPQQWVALTNGVVSSAIDVSFRLRDGSFSLFPQPPTDGLEISFEYISRNWVIDATDGVSMIAECVQGGDTPLFDRTLISRMLKVKYLENKTLPTEKAQADLNQCFALLTGADKGSPILNAGGRRYHMFLGPQNIPDGGWG